MCRGGQHRRRNTLSSRRDDRSSRRGARSSRRGARSSRRGARSSRRDDRSIRRDDCSSIRDDRSSRRDDCSSRRDDCSSRRDDCSSRRDDCSSRRDDCSLRRSLLTISWMRAPSDGPRVTFDAARSSGDRTPARCLGHARHRMDRASRSMPHALQAMTAPVQQTLAAPDEDDLQVHPMRRTPGLMGRSGHAMEGALHLPSVRAMSTSAHAMDESGGPSVAPSIAFDGWQIRFDGRVDRSDRPSG